MILITDLYSLKGFIEEQIKALPAKLTFVLIGNGEDAIDDIQAYYTNTYADGEFAGQTAFLQIAEAETNNNGHGGNGLLFFCGITIATKPLGRTATERLDARNDTLKTIMNLIGLLEINMEESQQDTDDADDGYEVTIALNRNRIMSIGKIANVFLEGWYIDLDVTIPANHLLFPD